MPLTWSGAEHLGHHRSFQCASAVKGKEFSFSVGPKTVEPESFLKCINRGASKEGGTRLQVGLLTSALRLAGLWGCPELCGMWRGTPGLYPLHARAFNPLKCLQTSQASPGDMASQVRKPAYRRMWNWFLGEKCGAC